MSSSNRIRNPSPLPPVPQISPFDRQFPDSIHHRSQLPKHERNYKDKATDEADPDPRELQNATTPISRTERRQAHTERRVRAWIRSTTPEFDMVTGDEVILQSEPQPHPTFKRAASSPYLHGPPYDSSGSCSAGVQAIRQADHANNSSQSRHLVSSEYSTLPSADYRDIDPYAKAAPIPVRTGSLPEPHSRRPSDPQAMKSQNRLPTEASESPTKQPRRPNPFSRGFSAGDIHIARLREIHNPSLSSIATHHTASSSGTKRSRPSLSNAFSVPRSEGIPEGMALGGVPLERKSPRKQPSLMKGLKGSFLGLLHKGEGEESRAHKKDSKADLRARAGQSLANEDEVDGRSIADNSASEDHGRSGRQETYHPLQKKAPGLDPSSAGSRPHLRRSSNSAPDDLPRTRLFSPITLHQAHAPSVWDPHNDLITSDFIESLTSPPRSSSLPKGMSEERIQNVEIERNKSMSRQFRIGSDTAAWEKKPDIPLVYNRVVPNGPSRGLPLVENPARPIPQTITHTKLHTPSPSTIRKTHRPRSQSWGAAQVLSGPPVMPLRLQKKRSEPILSINTGSAVVETSPAAIITLRAQDQHDLPRGGINNAHRATHQHPGSWPPQSLAPKRGDPPGKTENIPVQLSDMFASPTSTEVHRQENAMRALEQALAAPAWSNVDFQADTPETKTRIPRPVSPKTNDRSPFTISPNNSSHRTVLVLKTPPRDPLPRVPSLSTPRRRVPPALDLTRTFDKPHSGSNKEHKIKAHAYPPLPRLSYTFDKEVVGKQRSKTGPRLVSVIFPSSAPATKVDFEVGPSEGVQSAGETVRGSTEDGSRETRIDWQQKHECAVSDLIAEREKRMKSESDLMRLHGKYLGAVKTISRLEIEIDQMRRSGLPRMSNHSALSQSTSMGSTLSSDSCLFTPEKSGGHDSLHQARSRQTKQCGHEKMGSMDTIDQLEMDLGQPWTSRMRD